MAVSSFQLVLWSPGPSPGLHLTEPPRLYSLLIILIKLQIWSKMLKITTTITSSKDGIDMITRPNLRADQISRTFMEKMCYICTVIEIRSWTTIWKQLTCFSELWYLGCGAYDARPFNYILKLYAIISIRCWINKLLFIWYVIILPGKLLLLILRTLFSVCSGRPKTVNSFIVTENYLLLT